MQDVGFTVEYIDGNGTKVVLLLIIISLWFIIEEFLLYVIMI